ncbi:MAG TPA: MOSC domain-containing protein [Rhizomicrobium sp.]
MHAVLDSIQTGRVASLGPQGVSSGFVKHARNGPVRVRTLGLEGDEQADLVSHGGPEKAVYGYALSQYGGWRADFPDLAGVFQSGAMGENLTISDMEEAGICVGDVHAIGTALLQVCQPRQPCFKFALRYNDNRLPRAMVRRRRSGWYYRVMQEGIIAAGDRVALAERPNPDFPFLRLVEIVYHGRAAPEDIARLADLPGLASQWRDAARSMIPPRSVET